MCFYFCFDSQQFFGLRIKRKKQKLVKNAKSMSLTKVRKNNAGKLEKTGFEKYFEFFFGEKKMFCTRKALLNFSKRRFSSKSVVISEHVKSALSNREPVVALESTIITHGMPRPHNLECAKRVQKIIETEVSF